MPIEFQYDKFHVQYTHKNVRKCSYVNNVVERVGWMLKNGRTNNILNHRGNRTFAADFWAFIIGA